MRSPLCVHEFVVKNSNGDAFPLSKFIGLVDSGGCTFSYLLFLVGGQSPKLFVLRRQAASLTRRVGGATKCYSSGLQCFGRLPPWRASCSASEVFSLTRRNLERCAADPAAP